MRDRELTFAERATWGTCPVCGAVDGTPCANIGIPLGLTVEGKWAAGGAHFGRLNKAPNKIREVPIT